MILRRYMDDVLYLEIQEFNVEKDVTHLFSTRIGWNQNRLLENLSEVLNVNEDNIYSAKQVHGTDVKVIYDEDKDVILKLEVDGLITNKAQIALTTYHADCVPIYFYDKIKKVIGLCHSGWKGTLNNISKAMIKKMENEFSSKPQDILVAIGPSIGSCCYEIKRDVYDMFSNTYKKVDDILYIRGDKIYLDLWTANKRNLLNSGILEKNIIISEFCTSCNIDTLYSYRKENTKDRMIGAIMLNA